MNNEQKIQNLRARIDKETSPERLHNIAVQLRDLGAWDAQYEAESKAHKIEREQAEKACA